MSFVTLVLGSLEISWQKISSDDIQDLNGVSPSIDGSLTKNSRVSCRIASNFRHWSNEHTLFEQNSSQFWRIAWFYHSSRLLAPNACRTILIDRKSGSWRIWECFLTLFTNRIDTIKSNNFKTHTGINSIGRLHRTLNENGRNNQNRQQNRHKN